MLDIPPELDFTSEHFDPSKALIAKNIYLPYPKAKVYNNLADWYSHTFKKRNSIPSNEESLKASKNECFVLKRNYEWYYETLGLDLPADFDIQKRFQKYTKRKRDCNGKYQVDRKVVVREMPSEMLQPIRSSKILVKRSDGSLRDCVFVNPDGTISSDKKERSINTKDKITKMKQLSPNVGNDSVPKLPNISRSKSVTPLLNCMPSTLISKKSDIESTNCDNASNISNPESPKKDTVLLSATAPSIVSEKLGTEFKKRDSFQNEPLENSQYNSLETSVTGVNKQSDLEFIKRDCVPRHNSTVVSSEEIPALKTGIKVHNDQSCIKDTPKLCVMSNDIIERKLEISESHTSVLKGSINSNNILEQSARPLIPNKKMPVNLQKSKTDSTSLGFIKNKSVLTRKTNVLNKKSTIILKKHKNIKKKVYSSSYISTNSFLQKPHGFKEKDCDNSKKEIKSLKDASSIVLKSPKVKKESCFHVKDSHEKKVNSVNNCSMSFNHKKDESLVNTKSDIMQKKITSRSLQRDSSSSVTLPTLSMKPDKVNKSPIKGVKSDIKSEISSSKSIQGVLASSILSNICSLSVKSQKVAEKLTNKNVNSDIIQKEISSSKSIQSGSASSTLLNDCSSSLKPHKVEENLVRDSMKSDIIQNESNSSKSVRGRSASLLTLSKVCSKQLDIESNKLNRNKNETASLLSMTTESSVNQHDILKENSNLVYTEIDILHKEVDCTNFNNDYSPVLIASVKEQNKNSDEINKRDETSEKIKSANYLSCNSNIIEITEVQNKNIDVEFLKNDDYHENVDSVNDAPLFNIQINSSDLAHKMHNSNQQEICTSESVNSNLCVMPVIQNEISHSEYDSSKHKSASPLKNGRMFKVKTSFKNNKNEFIQNKMQAKNLFSETIANVKSHKKSDLQSKESHNPKQRSYTSAESCAVTSVSPLKEQNKKVYEGSKKCNSPLKEINAKNSLPTPLLKKDKENTKELALLELARRARKRLC